MFKHLFAAPLGLCIVLSTPQLAFSQTVTDAQDAAVAQPPALGETYTAETNGDWQLRCVKSDAANDPCQMYQLLSDDNGTAVAEVSFFRLPPEGQAIAGGTIVVPLETALPNGIRLTIDEGAAKTYPYAFCNPVGCYARIGLTEGDVTDFKRGNQAVLAIVPAQAPDQTVAISISLTGFTATFDKVTVIKP